MALDASRKVPIPEHGTVKRKMGDKIYLYYATAVYRNERGNLPQTVFLLVVTMKKAVC